jgi:hAT family C-terminal dimerisation region
MRGTIGCKKFPILSLLARDTLLCMGSSVPSESSFSDSGGFVTGDRARHTEVLESLVSCYEEEVNIEMAIT